MHKLFEKVCKNRGYEVSNNNMVLFNVNGEEYKLEYRHGNVVSLSRKLSNGIATDDMESVVNLDCLSEAVFLNCKMSNLGVSRWLLVESECFNSYKDNKNEFRKALNHYLGYLEKKYYLTEKEQIARNELLSQIEEKTGKSIKGDKSFEDFVLSVYKLGSESNIAIA